MVIIRRNPDGSIASQEGGVNMNTPSHPALATKRGMQALADAGRPVSTLMSEIATKVNNAKDKPRKLKVLKDHDSVPLRQILKGAFDPKIEWLLPKGDDIPYNKNDAPIGTEHTLLSQEAKRLYLFTKGGDNTLSQNKRETLFIQMLEGLSAQEADFLVTVVNKKVNNKYKGFTANLVKEAFDWNDDFMKKE
jgi:hypothetical protein|tara:strand:- start:441 stop:1016 length:576 start_codon:yes stop_codon:yes gene_type:complete